MGSRFPGGSRGAFQNFPEWHIPANRRNFGAKHMTRLMCTRDRQEVETLKSKLFRAGIRSEIRNNPLASEVGVTQLDIFIDERDLFGASKVRQSLETVVGADDAPRSPEGCRRINGPVEVEESELVTEIELLLSLSI